MKIHHFTRILFIFLAILFVSHSQAAESKFPPFAAKNSQGLAGGYRPAKIDQTVQKAAEFAVNSRAKTESSPLKLVSISKAEKQVVAGMNYHLLLTLNQSGKSRTAEAIVYQSLDSRYQLTSWRWLP